MKKWILAGLAAFGLGFIVVVYVARQQREQERGALDSRIATELKQPIDECLRRIPETDPFFTIAGKFQSWNPSRHRRLHHIDWQQTYLLISGTAKFENADVPVSVSVFRGPLNVTSGSQTQSLWLAEHPEQGVAIVNRQIVVSEKYAKDRSGILVAETPAVDEPTANDPNLLVPGPMSTEVYPSIEIEAKHPAFVD